MSFSSEVSSFPGGFPTDGNDGQDVDAASQPKNIADVASSLKNSIADALASIDGTAACISRRTATDMRVKIVVALRLSSIAYCKLRSQGSLITSLRDPIIAAGQVAAMIPILLVTAVKLSRSCTAALFWFAISLPVTILTGIATGCKSVGRRIAAPFHAAYTRSPFYAHPTPQPTGIWSYMPALLTPSLFSSPVYGLFRTPGGRHMSRLQFLLPGVRTVLRVGGVPAAHVDMASYVVASYPILFLAAVGL